jgi:hypothetical protein
MPILVADCPRCGAQRMTFEARGATEIGIAYGWQRRYEVFAVCKHCWRSTVFVLAQSEAEDHVRDFLTNPGLMAAPGSLTDFMRVDDYISLKDESAEPPPEHLPAAVAAAFTEGAKCLAIGCCNAAGTMFRLAIDLSTRPMLPPETDTSISRKERRDLGLRLPWLFKSGRLPSTLQELSVSVREDGNDGAHQGTLTQIDAQDLLEFATLLLERIFTEPERLRLAAARRAGRHTP